MYGPKMERMSVQQKVDEKIMHMYCFIGPNVYGVYYNVAVNYSSIAEPDPAETDCWAQGSVPRMFLPSPEPVIIEEPEPEEQTVQEQEQEEET